MSLATRCPKCNTVFQVNEEQLKRYSGVVRCGVCNTPFNGIDHLIGRLSHNDTPSSSLKTDNTSANTRNDTTKDLANNNEQFPADGGISLDIQPSFPERIEDNENLSINEAREAALKTAFEKQIQSISFDLDLPSLNEGKLASPETQPDTSTVLDVDTRSSENTDIHLKSEKKEPFLSPETAKEDQIPPIIINVPDSAIKKPVNHEELVNIVRQKQKRSGFSQFLWAIGTFVLLAILGIQGIYRYSEDIIVWWPPAEELVNSTCELLSCPIEKRVIKPPLSIEAAIPEKLENSTDQYSQTITITNNSQEMQLWPSLVLELTDQDNKVLIRRTLEPQEYLPELAGTAKGLQPASDVTFKMTFEFTYNSAFKSQVSLLDKP